MKKEPDKIKKARTDRSDKLKLRKSTDETVVKSTLLNYLLGDQEVKLKFINAIQSRVLSFSKRINMASLSLNEIIKISFNGTIRVSISPAPTVKSNSGFFALI